MDRVIEPTAARCRCPRRSEQPPLGVEVAAGGRAIEHGDLDQLALSDVETKEIAVDGGTEGGADRRVARDRRGLAGRCRRQALQECHVGAGVVEALVLDLDLVGVPARRQRTAIALQVEAMDRVIEPTAARCRCPRRSEQPPLGVEVAAGGRAIEHGDLDQLALSDVEGEVIRLKGISSAPSESRIAANWFGSSTGEPRHQGNCDQQYD